MVRDFKGTMSEKAYAENTPSPYSAHNPEWTTVAALEFIEEKPRIGGVIFISKWKRRGQRSRCLKR